MLHLLLRATALALAPAAAAAQIPPPATASEALGAEQWREDLRFMAAEMERRHGNLFHSVDREAFRRAVADLDARIPQLRRNQIIVGMMRIAAMVGDGHTRVDPRKDAKFGFPSLPLKLYLFEDGLYVRAARPDHRALLGARIEAIGGVPVAEALRRVRTITSVDNEVGYRLFAPLYLAMPDILHALDLAGSSSAVELSLVKDGRRWTQKVAAGQVDPLWPPDTDVSLVTPDGWADARTAPQPLWLQAPLDYHRLILLPDRSALYAQINMITGTEGQSLAEFGERIRQTAEASNPRAIILDFRLSYGGNHDLRHLFVREMVKAEDADTRLFVLVWRGSFSATEAILVDLDRLTDAVFFGEPASSRPNSWGDAYRMPMPNSGISLRTSLYFNQLKGQSQEPWTPIDVSTPYSFADYAAGRDPALEAALSYTAPPPLEERVVAAGRSGDATAVRRLLAAYRADPANRYRNWELLLSRTAEALVARAKPEAALAVAQFGVEELPGSAMASNVLAHVAERAKRPDIALKAGRRVLELDPDNRAARSLVERLQAPPAK
jgi:hypothetical protein